MPTPSGPPARYHAWLLRCWEEREQAAATWRFSLEDPHTGARQGFADLAALAAFLAARLGGEVAGVRLAGSVRGGPVAPPAMSTREGGQQ